MLGYRSLDLEDTIWFFLTIHPVEVHAIDQLTKDDVLAHSHGVSAAPAVMTVWKIMAMRA